MQCWYINIYFLLNKFYYKVLIKSFDSLWNNYLSFNVPFHLVLDVRKSSNFHYFFIRVSARFPIPWIFTSNQGSTKWFSSVIPFLFVWNVPNVWNCDKKSKILLFTHFPLGEESTMPGYIRFIWPCFCDGNLFLWQKLLSVEKQILWQKLLS